MSTHRVRRAVAVTGLATVTTLAGALAIAANASGGEAGVQTVRVTLKQENKSGQSGAATLVSRGSGFVVTIKVSAPKKFPGRAQNAHIHRGTCAAYRRLNSFDAQLATVVDQLNNLSRNRSRTVVPIPPLKQRTTGRYSINVHEQNAPYTVVACGNIPRR